ncbi:hypothetical protein AB0N05_16650 [Nocardia sp. NPDC051030]|uniref:hypothetical protein n=1 Tax=Nocardia sp. NPDC051030 TaxID=3155162 RepID=UPI00341F3355
MIAPCLRLVGVVSGAALLSACTHAEPRGEAMAVDTTEMQRSAFVTECTGTSAGWQATAVVSNRDQIEHTYLVVISFLSPEAIVLDRTRTEIVVAPGATQDFTTETRLDPVDRPQSVRCVLRGVEQL